jgi:Flp pilus assembly protein TadG
MPKSPRATRVRDEKGVILVFWVLALTLIAGLMALAIAAGNLVENSTNYQNAADAAALSAATATRDSTTLAQAELAATDAAETVARQGYGVTGNWGACNTPAGFSSEDAADDCVGFYPYNLEATAVGTSTPTLSLSAPSTATPGQPIAISATLAGSGASSGGTIGFFVIGPEGSPPSSCTGGFPVGQAPVQVAGDGAYGPTPGYTPSQAGNYWWYASYSGDANDAPASTGCTEETVVGEGTPSLTLSVPDTGTVGTAIQDDDIEAVLSGASDIQNIDTITFTVFGPQLNQPTDCTVTGQTDEVVVGSAVTVAADGPYSPNANPYFTPSATGNYWWYASYSGDANNTPANSGCGPPVETVVGTSGTAPLLAISAPNFDAVGTAIPDSAINAILSGTANVQNGDTITFTIFGPQSTAPTGCTTGGTQVGNPVAVTGDGTYNPDLPTGFTPTQTGEYWWSASFSGDVGGNPNGPAESACGAGEMTVGQSVPTLTISAPDSATYGTTIPAADIGATIASSSSSPPSGDITFTVFGPEAGPPTSCSSGGGQVGLTVPVNGAKTYNPTAGYLPPTPGNYWWYASYTGDAENLPSNTACGISETTVGLSTPTLTISAPNTDSTSTSMPATGIVASLTGTSGASAGGTITFWLSGPGAQPTTCPGSTGWAQLGSQVAVAGDNPYSPTTGYAPTQAGDYWWYAVYSGDADNTGANSGCPPPVETVVQPAENLSVTAPSAGALGGAINITATLSGPTSGIPTGTITFWVYESSAGTAPTSCPGPAATGWAQVGGAGTTVPVNGYGSYVSPAYTLTTPGNYFWYASYSGDDNDVPTDTGCGIVIWVQIPTQNVATLFGTGGGGSFTRSAYAFGSTTSDLAEGKLCYFPGDCDAAS